MHDISDFGVVSLVIYLSNFD